MWLKLPGRIIEKSVIIPLLLEIFLLARCSICFLSIVKHSCLHSWDLMIKQFLWRVDYCIPTKNFFVSVF